MGSPNSEMSLDSRMSTALARLERMTELDKGVCDGRASPQTVEEAVKRLKHKVSDKDS